LLWPLRILGFPLQPAIDQQSPLSFVQNQISSLTSSSPTEPFFCLLPIAKHLPRFPHLTLPDSPLISISFRQERERERAPKTSPHPGIPFSRPFLPLHLKQPSLST
jgi:hypothetical protein